MLIVLNHSASAKDVENIKKIFTRTELYATCAFVGACSYLVIYSTTSNEGAAVTACIAVTFILRMLAIRYKIRLPL